MRAAIQAQNAQVSAGQLGAAPAVPGQQLNATVSAQSRLQRPEQFEAIVLRSERSGAIVRLRDVARVELGSESYDSTARYNGKPSSGMAIQLATGANALDTADRVRATLDELKSLFPPGVHAVTAFDTTPFVSLSIEAVVTTLVEAIVARVRRHVRLPAERSRDADHHAHGAGRTARHVRRAGRHSASASTR